MVFIIPPGRDRTPRLQLTYEMSDTDCVTRPIKGGGNCQAKDIRQSMATLPQPGDEGRILEDPQTGC